MRGRKPTPSRVAFLRGFPGHRAANKNEPKPRPGSIKPPEYLGKQAKKVWQEVAPELFDLGLLTVLDHQALARYSALHARWIATEKFLDKNGSTYKIKDDEGKVKYIGQYPQVSMNRNLAKLSNALGLEFGLTASARVRLHVEPLYDGDEKDRRFFG